GIFTGHGTLMVMMFNFIMLGSFQYFFYEQGGFWESVRGIWIHGSLEIFAIVMEAAAGFIFGAGILFPKTYSRLASLKISCNRGLKCVISTTPFTFVAGMLAGFVTHFSPVMPPVLNVLILLFTLALISSYYLVYPFMANKKIQKQHV